MISPIVKADMVKIDSMKQVQEKIDAILQPYQRDKCLLAFDIDMTLVVPNHPAAFFPNIKKYHDIMKECFLGLDSEQLDVVLNLLVLNLPQKVIEEDASKIIAQYQQQGIKTIAFTACLSGKLGEVDRIEQVRYETLKSLGFSFSKTFPAIQDETLEDIPQYRSHHPVFYKGILVSNGERGISCKGRTLISFLNKFHFSPQVIVLVDDKRKNLEDVERALKDYNNSIRFVGIEYTKGLSFEEGAISETAFRAFWSDLTMKSKKITLPK